MTQSELIENALYISEEITQKFKPINGSCLYMSALLVAIITDHLSRDARFVTGSLEVSGSTIFSHTPIKPKLTQNLHVIEQWDGHAWVELDDFIFDLSIFRTVFSRASPPRIQSLFEARFHRDTAYLVGQKCKLIEMEMKYTALEQLSDVEATTLIQSANKMQLINH